MGLTRLKLHTIISQYTFNNKNAKIKLSISWFRYSKLNAKLLNIDKTETEDTFLILAGFSEARNTCDRDEVLLEDTETIGVTCLNNLTLPKLLSNQIYLSGF